MRTARFKECKDACEDGRIVITSSSEVDGKTTVTLTVQKMLFSALTEEELKDVALGHLNSPRPIISCSHVTDGREVNVTITLGRNPHVVKQKSSARASKETSDEEAESLGMHTHLQRHRNRSKNARRV